MRRTCAAFHESMPLTSESYLALELELVRSETRRNLDRLRALLTDDFVEFGSSGRVFSREEVIAALRDESSFEMTISGFRAVVLSEAAVLVTYQAAVRRSDQPGESRSLRSSIWVEDEGRWRIRFHQGTRLAAEAPR